MAGPQPVLSAEELESKGRSLAALEELIRGGTALLFAGAGFSVPAGYPPWTLLLTELEGLCDQCGSGFARDPELLKNDPLRYVDMIKKHIADVTGSLKRYHKFLLQRFYDEPKLQQFHRDLIALPFRGFLTTNYDHVVEAALATAEPEPMEKKVIVGSDPGYVVHKFMQSLLSANSARLVAHLHGYYRRPNTIVLSGADYTATYGPPDRDRSVRGSQENAELDSAESIPYPVPAFLRTVLSTWSLVFVGFSFADPYFELFLRAASNEYELWGDSNHFALIDTTPDAAKSDAERARRYRETYGLQIVFYERQADSHAGLYDIISDLRQAIVPVRRSPLLDNVNARMAEVMRE